MPSSALESKVEEIKKELDCLLTTDGRQTKLREGDTMSFHRDVGTISFGRAQRLGDNRLFFGDRCGKDDKRFVGSILQDRKVCEMLTNSVASQYGFRVELARDTESLTIYQFVRS